MKHLTDQLGAPFVLPKRRRSRVAQAIVALLVGVVLLAGLVHFAGNALLNRFLRPKLEQAFAAENPGYGLRVGALHYTAWGDRLHCTAVTLTQPDGAPASARSITLTGLKWSRLLLGNRKPAELIRSARLEVTDLSAGVLAAEYRVRCEHLRVSVPDGEIVAKSLSLQPVASEEAFFAATPFRRVRQRLTVASCALRGVGFAALFAGQAYRAKSVEVVGPVLESLANREKPRQPVTVQPPLPHEALAAIGKPFRIDQLTLTDGLIKVAARRSADAEPGVLTFSALQLRANDIANAAAGGREIGLHAETKLMDAGTLTVQMQIPVAPASLAFRYSGKLSAMDLTRLDEYMEGAGRIQIESGRAHEAQFDIDVMDGHARGALRGEYRDLQVKVVDGETGRADGVISRVATVLANELKVKDDNTPAKPDTMKAGKVDYIRKPNEGFLQFAWLALRTGILDLIDPQTSAAP